jgi:two-component system LytT family response regulator
MRALIIEDEILAAKHLRHVLDEIGGITVITVLESIVESVEWFKTNSLPEIVFMDIHLADGSAFEIFRHVNITCPIIFTTAYDEYALKAFKVNSIDYLLKPIDTEEVQSALEKLKRLSTADNSLTDIKNLIASFKKVLTYKTHFLIPSKGDKLIPVQAGEIACIFIDASIVKAMTFEEKSFRFEYTLDELIYILDPKDFFRANRQFIISRKAIKDIDLWFNSRLSVNLKVVVPEKIFISKARIQEFKSWFGGI